MRSISELSALREGKVTNLNIAQSALSQIDAPIGEMRIYASSEHVTKTTHNRTAR